MGEKSLGRYDHPSILTRRETFVAGAAGTGTKNRFFHHQAIRLKAVHFVVRTAGTAAGFVATPTVGGTAMGTATLGTNTAGYTATLQIGTGNDPKGYVGAANDDIACTIAGDATGVVDVSYEYETLPGALMAD